MRKNILYVIFMLSVLTFIYSCEKKEPAKQPAPDEIIKKIIEKFPDLSSKDLSKSEITELYSEDKNKPVDLSKIEKYSVIKATEDFAVEIGIFKLYDKGSAEYVKNMAKTRISKMQASGSDVPASEIFNGAEVRSYGNYVYYVSHSQKDKIFEIIENALKGV